MQPLGKNSSTAYVDETIGLRKVKCTEFDQVVTYSSIGLTQPCRDDRILTAGSFGLLYYQSSTLVASVNNVILFDRIGPPKIGGSPQTSIQIVTRNEITGQKTTYNPPSLHFLPAGTIDIQAKDNIGSVFATGSIVNPIDQLITK